MPYTSDPLNSLTDAARLLVGDTGTPEILSDSEYSYFLSISGDGPFTAAVLASRAIAGKYSSLADEETGEVSVKFSQKSKQYLALAKELEKQKDSSLISTPMAMSTGTSLSDVSTRSSNTDRPLDMFSIGQTDNFSSSF